MSVLIGHEAFSSGGVLHLHLGLFLFGTDEVHRIRAVHVLGALGFEAFFHGGGLLVQAREGRPWLVGRAFAWFLRHDLQHSDVLGALADGRAQAVGSGVAATDDHDVVDWLDAVDAAGRVGQEFHGKVDALEFTARNLHVARHGGADGDDHGIVAGSQIVP